MNTIICCDFDGTISRRDVGYHMFHHFSGGENVKFLPDWKAGIMSSREILTKEAALVKASPEEIYAYLDQFDIDPGFVEFEALCREQEVPLYILSDGLDFYIHHILRRYGLSHLPLMCNTGHLEESSIRVTFPRVNQECVRCGTCKGEIIEQLRSAGEMPARVAFIGDGYSDRCAAGAADLLFAKKDLAEYCTREGIAFTSYHDFYDVARLLIGHGYLQPKTSQPARGE